MSRAQDLLLGAALVVVLSTTGTGCSCDGAADGPPDAGPITFDQCDSDTAAWVRNSYLAIVGHRPHSQAEVDVYVALHDQIAALVAEERTTLDPREVVARAMTQEPAYLPRWTSHFIDALRVPRTDEQAMGSCYDDLGTAASSTELAGFIRDNPPTERHTEFSMLDLVQSAIALDDPTPIYRGHLFALVGFPIPAANVPPDKAELARREDYGAVFDSAYLNRDLVCLMCHNSENAVTDSVDPALDRHFPIAGLYEQALFGASSGVEPERSHAMFRFDGFSASSTKSGEGPRRPWGWSGGCGSFLNDPGPDPVGIDGKFGNLAGMSLTVYELEASLRAGFEGLRGGAIVPGDGGAIADPDQALAYLTAATIVEGVWKEVIGSGLTIANYFPRNQAASDLLKSLTDRFLASGYSLSDLLVAIVSSDYFSRQLPEQACGDDPYIYPNVYDPWVTSDSDEARRLNGPGDAIAAISARTLMRGAYEAMQWPVPEGIDFPGGSDPGFCDDLPCGQLENACNQNFCCDTYAALCGGGGGGGASDELPFQQGVGAFIKNGERGFRGLDFQARLVWEDRFGTCAKPGSGNDFVDELVTAAAADGEATVQDVVVALKDRLIGEPAIDPGAESEALVALMGGALDRGAGTVTDLEVRTRALCGVLLSSPQFVLSGAAGRGGAVPRLTPAAWQFDAVCADLVPRVADADASGLAVTCAEGVLTATVAPLP